MKAFDGLEAVVVQNSSRTAVVQMAVGLEAVLQKLVDTKVDLDAIVHQCFPFLFVIILLSGQNAVDS